MASLKQKKKADKIMFTNQSKTTSFHSYDNYNHPVILISFIFMALRKSTILALCFVFTVLPFAHLI